MKILDTNLLVYAIDLDSPHHDRAARWLEAALSTDETIGVPWAVALGFVRITTNPRIMGQPLSSEQALDVLDALFAHSNVVEVSPGPDHRRVLGMLLARARVAGNLTMDAHLAAIAIEHDAELCSADGDFSRFKTLRWVNPLAE